HRGWRAPRTASGHPPRRTPRPPRLSAATHGCDAARRACSRSAAARSALRPRTWAGSADAAAPPSRGPAAASRRCRATYGVDARETFVRQYSARPRRLLTPETPVREPPEAGSRTGRLGDYDEVVFVDRRRLAFRGRGRAPSARSFAPCAASSSTSTVTRGSLASTSTRSPNSCAVSAVFGPMQATSVRACGLPAIPTRFRTVDAEVKHTASNPPVLIISRVSAGGG